MFFSTLTIATALAALLATASAKGINCQGSGLCPGNKGLLSQALTQLRTKDQHQQWSQNEKLICIESSITIGKPNLCIFYQNIGDRKFTTAQSIQYIEGLLNHGCQACGSIPTDDGNDVSKGELTANMVASGNQKRAIDADAKLTKRRDVEHPSQLFRRQGINCNGGAACRLGGLAGTPRGKISDLYDTISAGNGIFRNGEQIECKPHASGRLCAFYQNIGNRSFNTQQTLEYLNRLLEHGCEVCGSVPTDDGNDVSKGELTVNYVA